MPDATLPDRSMPSSTKQVNLQDLVPVPPPDRKHAQRRSAGLAEPDLIDAAAHKVHPNFFVRLVTSRRFWLIISFTIIIGAFICLPYLFWLAAPELELKVAVVDKTVPYENYREHRGLFWLLNQNKFIDSTTVENERWYDHRYDYTGFDPVDPPGYWRSTLVRPEILADSDVLYIADTYGTYRSDYSSDENEEIVNRPAARQTVTLPPAVDTGAGDDDDYTAEPAANPAVAEEATDSNMLFGGLEDEEVAAIENFVRSGRLLIGEFNCFAYPTEGENRARMENAFGVTWTGWIGCWIGDFEDETAVPGWLRLRYQEVNGRAWDVSGSGFILCSHDTGDFIILKADEDVVKNRGLELVPRREYADQDVMQGVRNCAFSYWFDIVEAQEGTDVLAEFRFSLTMEGQNKFNEYGLDSIFPAVTLKRAQFEEYVPQPAGDEQPGTESELEPSEPAVSEPEHEGRRDRTEYSAYYLAGDMVDFNAAMGPPHTRLTLYINRSYYGRPVVGSNGYFFWHTYFPMLSNILREECNRITKQPRNVYLFD